MRISEPASLAGSRRGYPWRMLRGRATERAAIERLLDRVRAGQGGGMVVRGEPGIGKTALLEVAGERATGMRVLRTAGVEPEADLGYATLHRLLLPVLEGVQRLPEPQARGLGVVFGQATGPPPDRFLVALATLSLLSELAGERPVLCLVDDAHWADRPSLDTLAFVARRLEAEPIALVMAARTDEGVPMDLPGLADLPLAGLDTESARALLVEHGGDRLSVLEQDELLRATGRNPLAIRELPAGARRGDGTAEPLPLADGLQQAFLERARRRAPAAQRLLLLMAADGTGQVDVLRRAAAAIGAGGEPFPPDELDELLTVVGPAVAFRHPLIRSAVYHGAGPADRRAAHRALAAALGEEPADLDRRAWHLGIAADGPDEWVAGELERSAERSIRRAGPAAAAAALTRAAELSRSDLDRARRSVAAATAWWQAGRKARAEASLVQAEASLVQAERLVREAAAGRRDVAGLRALIELRAGSPVNAVFLLRPVIPEALVDDRHRAIELLMLFGEASYHASAVQVWAEIAEAVERLDLTGDGVDDTLARLIRAVCRVRTGADPGLAPSDLDAVERLTDPRRLCWAGGLLLGLGEDARGRSLRRQAMLRARALGAVGTLAWVLEFVVVDELAGGRFGNAEAYADEGLRHAEETGQPNLGCWFRGSLASLAALRGREKEARQLAGEVLADASARDLAAARSFAHRALGLLELAAGRSEEALEHFRPMQDVDGSVHLGIVLQNAPEFVEAAAQLHQEERATEPLGGLTRLAEATKAPHLLALVARCRALVGAGDPERQFQQAIALHAGAGRPMEQARTELLFGEHLRRERRRADARPHLRAALETFQRLGMPVWADRARDELRATGEATGDPATDTLAHLTPQELRIAAAVGEGATNREVAAQLFLSPRTVDYHLRKVFQKLCISSRADLIRLVAAAASQSRRAR
jgi:DNA-binding CsgD family transcriptional regulator